jgi:hypothetical protein
LKLLITKISGIPSKQLRLKFQNEQPMDDDAKFLSDYKDFLTDPVTVEIHYSRSAPTATTPRLMQTARKTPGFFARKSLAGGSSSPANPPSPRESPEKALAFKSTKDVWF